MLTEKTDEDVSLRSKMYYVRGLAAIIVPSLVGTFRCYWLVYPRAAISNNEQNSIDRNTIT